MPAISWRRVAAVATATRRARKGAKERKRREREREERKREEIFGRALVFEATWREMTCKIRERRFALSTLTTH